MTLRRVSLWSLFRITLLLCVYGLGIIAIVASGGRPPASTYSPSTQANPSCPPPVNETKPVSAIQLVEVTPPVDLPVERVITISRQYEEKYLFSSCSSLSRSSRYLAQGNIALTDRDLQFGFGFSPLDLTSYEERSSVTSVPLGLSVVVKNTAARAATIDWNAVTIIDGTGKTYGVIHRGVKMVDRSGVLAPSTIPPGAALEDFVYPRELMTFSGGRYASWIAVNFFEAFKPPQRFKLYLPVKFGNDTLEYQFAFEVIAP
jgi:hypothetical protein